MDGFVKDDEPDLLLPPNSNNKPLLEAGDVALVSRQEGETKFTAVLYIRPYLVELQRKLNFVVNEEKDQLYLTGLPGCGTTCFLYLWARRLAVLQQKRILIVQYRPEAQSCCIWIRVAGTGALWRLNKSIDRVDLRKEVKAVLEENMVTRVDLLQEVEAVLEENKTAGTPFDLCLHDGFIYADDFNTSIQSTLNTAIEAQQIKKVVHVTSRAYWLSTGGQRLDSEGPIVQLSVDSWNLQDYHDAIECPAFLAAIDAGQIGDKLKADQKTLVPAGAGPNHATSLVDVIDARYYYAGGCVRFMFEFNLSELREELGTACDNMTEDEWKFFAASSIGTGTPDVVNTLMQHFGRKASPVSRYILFRAYEICKTDLVTGMQRVVAEGSNNPALKGWAFELAQIDLICLCIKSPQQQSECFTNHYGLSFVPRFEIYFDGEKLLQKNGVGLQDGDGLQDGTVIWCMKWNQGCFDVAFYKNHKLVTIQFTISEQHDLKPIFIRRLRDTLLLKYNGASPVTECIHIGISTAENLKFKVDSAGTGRQHKPDEIPMFTIQAYRSLPLYKTIQSPTSPGFNIGIGSDLLATIDMYELSSAAKRSRPGK
jgi:hypothetical protein